MKPCPFCGEQIQEVAVKCRYCGEWLDPSRRPEAITKAAPAPAPEAAPVAAHAAAPESIPPTPVEAPRMVGARTELWVPPGRTDLSLGTASREASRPGPPPAWNPPADGIPADTIRGVPAITLDPIPSPNHIPTLLPEIERQAPSARSDIGAVQVVGRASLPPISVDVDLDILPAAPPPPPPLELAPAPPPAPTPPPPPGDAAAPFQARSADAFMQAFLGAAEPEPEGGDEDPFAASNVAPAPPPPWPMIAGVGAVVVVVLFLFKDALLGPAEPAGETPPVEAAAEPAPEAKAPEVKPEPPPETKLAETRAEPKPPPAPPPTDPAFTELLGKAKAAYSDGKLKATAAALADLSKQAPEHPEVLLLTAQVQLEEGKMTESKATADRCVAVDPNLADCWLTLGVLRQSGKDDAGAVAAYETYLKLAPTGRYARDANSQLARLKKSSG